MRRCPGFDGYCNAPLTRETTWVVGETMRRGEWDACERCALEALRYTHAEVWDLVDGEPLTLEAAS